MSLGKLCMNKMKILRENMKKKQILKMNNTKTELKKFNAWVQQQI